MFSPTRYSEKDAEEAHPSVAAEYSLGYVRHGSVLYCELGSCFDISVDASANQLLTIHTTETGGSSYQKEDLAKRPQWAIRFLELHTTLFPQSGSGAGYRTLGHSF